MNISIKINPATFSNRILANPHPQLRVIRSVHGEVETTFLVVVVAGVAEVG